MNRELVTIMIQIWSQPLSRGWYMYLPLSTVCNNLACIPLNREETEFDWWLTGMENVVYFYWLYNILNMIHWNNNYIVVVSLRITLKILTGSLALGFCLVWMGTKVSTWKFYPLHVNSSFYFSRSDVTPRVITFSSVSAVYKLWVLMSQWTSVGWKLTWQNTLSEFSKWASFRCNLDNIRHYLHYLLPVI